MSAAARWSAPTRGCDRAPNWPKTPASAISSRSRTRTVDEGAKINHLSYIGDATVGAGSNIGAGTITCNYDGVMKHRTEIGAGVFIGSNTMLVAPVSLGDRSMTATGLGDHPRRRAGRPGHRARGAGEQTGQSDQIVRIVKGAQA